MFRLLSDLATFVREYQACGELDGGRDGLVGLACSGGQGSFAWLTALLPAQTGTYPPIG
jgi:hypothetical protein